MDLMQIVTTAVIAGILGGFVALTYRFSYSGAMFSSKFAKNMILLAVLTSMAMVLLMTSPGVVLGLISAVAIARFRTPVRETADVVYAYWAVVIGMSCGAGEYLVGTLGSVATFLVLLFGRGLHRDDLILLIIHGGRRIELGAESVVFKSFSRRASLRTKSFKGDELELVYQISPRVLSRAQEEHPHLMDELYAVDGVKFVDLVTQRSCEEC